MKRELHSSARVAVTLLVLAGVALLLPRNVHPGARLLISWNAAVLTFLAIVVYTISGADAHEVRTRSQRDGEGRFRVLVGIVLVCLASLVAVAVVLYNVKRQEPGFRLQVLLCLASVFIAWLLLQTMFALFYARYYYQPAKGRDTVVGGLHFVSDEPPDYWDFVYFSYTIGTSYSTSDTTIESRTLRRAVLLQAMLSFLFYTILIGLVMNAISALF